ncbi:MAG: rhamnulokinase [Synergistaceae bacterium]|nr:rhamnulokinase [Synergistaceae bacterium]
MKYYLAVDIGASSGRHILGWKEDGQIKTRELYRFPNGVTEREGRLTWDIEALVSHVKAGIDKAIAECSDIVSLSVDTWGVDYVLMKGDSEVLPCYAYRDTRTEASIPEVHKMIPFEELYSKTGIQFQPFNTIYQLYADKMAGRLGGVTDFLMMPEYLLYKLCGVKSHEYTNATTGGMINASTGTYDTEIISRLGLPPELFCTLSQPGTKLGTYKGIQCVLCASHDTASAVEGIPMEGDEIFISSGTWSLLGAKIHTPITSPESMKANYTNEGGVGYTRYLKNIMGMWLINRLRDELCAGKEFGEIVSEAEASTFDEVVNADDKVFLAPESMKAAFDSQLSAKPKDSAGYFRCAYRSLAQSYKRAVEEMESITGKTYTSIYIVGGGAKNKFLNSLTEQATGKKVIALPIEATALGNLKIQMEAIN